MDAFLNLLAWLWLYFTAITACWFGLVYMARSERGQRYFRWARPPVPTYPHRTGTSMADLVNAAMHQDSPRITQARQQARHAMLPLHHDWMVPSAARGARMAEIAKGNLRDWEPFLASVPDTPGMLK